MSVHPTSTRLDGVRFVRLTLLTALYTMEDQSRCTFSDVLVRGLDTMWLRDGPRAEALAAQAQEGNSG